MVGQGAQQNAHPPLNEEKAMKSLISAKLIHLLALALGVLSVPNASLAATTWNADTLCTVDGAIVSSCGGVDPTLFGASNATSGMAAGGAGSTNFTTASVYDWGSAGLGVVNKYENANDTGPHAIDNKYGTDAIFLKFSGLVKLSNVAIGFNGTDNCGTTPGGCTGSAVSVYNDSDLSVFAWVGGSSAPSAPTITGVGPTTLTAANSGWQLVGNYADVGRNVGSGGDLDNSQNITSSIYSSYWLVSAYNTAYGNVNSNGQCTTGCNGLDGFNDQFKLLAVSYDSKVPEPSGLALLALALLALVATRRNWSVGTAPLLARA